MFQTRPSMPTFVENIHILTCYGFTSALHNTKKCRQTSLPTFTLTWIASLISQKEGTTETCISVHLPLVHESSCQGKAVRITTQNQVVRFPRTKNEKQQRNLSETSCSIHKCEAMFRAIVSTSAAIAWRTIWWSKGGYRRVRNSEIVNHLSNCWNKSMKTKKCAMG